MIRLDEYRTSDFERGASPLKEALWWVARSLLFAPWFPIPSLIKVKALRVFGAKIGENVIIRSRVNITFPWRIEIGDYVWIGDEVFILSLAPVCIESNVCISQRAFLCTGSHNFKKQSFDLITEPIHIGEGSWICAQAFIGPGSQIPPGTMIKAGEVFSNRGKTSSFETQ
ncbi:MAG: WcaF family extracellular polysaccharide biosynthesis acetyltransferase [Verrucomicrobiota bacterium]